MAALPVFLLPLFWAGSYSLFCWIERTKPVPGSTVTVAVATRLLSLVGMVEVRPFQAAFIIFGLIAVVIFRPPRFSVFSRSSGVLPRAEKALLSMICRRTYSQ